MGAVRLQHSNQAAVLSRVSLEYFGFVFQLDEQVHVNPISRRRHSHFETIALLSSNIPVQQWPPRGFILHSPSALQCESDVDASKSFEESKIPVDS